MTPIPLPETAHKDPAVEQNFQALAQKAGEPVARNQVSAGFLQTASITTGALGAAGGPVTVTWGTAFPDANYRCLALVEDNVSAEGALSFSHLESKTASAAVFYVANGTGSSRTGTLHALAVKDS